MKCISSPALDDIEIAKYVDGGADETVIAHIQECSFCGEKAGRWTLLQNRLKKQLFRASCPTPMELGDYHLRMLPAPQMLLVAQHVRGCPLCRREVAELEEFLKDPVQEVGLLRRAKVLFARLTGDQTSSGRREESFGPAILALRGGAKGPLIFEADGVVIVLEVQPTADERASIVGQVAADEQDQWTAAVVELNQAGAPEKTASLDEFGAFRFDDIHPGATQITIGSLHGIIVHIMNIEISI